MTLVRDLGEFGSIAHLAKRLQRRVPQPPALLLGIGDDAALWQPTPGWASVLTTDTMLEGVHFTRQTTPPRDLGWKSLAVNLSDCAAMAAQPRLALLTLGLTGAESLDWLDAVADGIADLAESCGVTIAGGDTIRAPQVQVGFTVLGEVEAGAEGPRTLRRNAAQPGDLLAVTGWLGDAAGGLRRLLAAESQAPNGPLVAAHRHPQPRLAEARFLRDQGVRCATDNSDGLLRELELVCAASAVGVEVSVEDLPVSPALRAACGSAALSLALAGGEDYELVLAIPQRRWPALATAWAERFALPVSVIGRFTPPATPAVRVRGADIHCSGFDHFLPVPP